MGGLLAFRVGNYDNTAEREQFRFLCQQLKAHFKDSGEFCVFVGNYNIGCELDALFIKKDAIISIEFKNYGGNVVANENGEWTADGVTIKGGSRKTVLQQARINHTIVKRELKALGVENKQIKDVPHLVVFHQPIYLDNRLSATNRSWLHITDDNHFVEKLDDITCPKTDFDPLDIVNLAELLNLNPFYLKEYSNANYEKPSTSPEQLAIFEDIKNANRNSVHTLHESENSISNRQDLEENNEEFEIESEESVSLKGFVKQILSSVLKVSDAIISIIDGSSSQSKYKKYGITINKKLLVKVESSGIGASCSKLAKFINQDVRIINPNVICWQEGDVIIDKIEEGTLLKNVNGLTDSNSNKNTIKFHKTKTIIPHWLDLALFNSLSAIYSPEYKKFEYNLNIDSEDIKVYLGTYFPRSYAEAFCIFDDIFKSHQYLEELKSVPVINILDYGCGTGGDLIGLIVALSKHISSSKKINIFAFDGNNVAINALKILLDILSSNIRHIISLTCFNKTIRCDEDFQITGIPECQFILNSKMVCELISKKITVGNCYYKVADSLAKLLAKNGILYILDVTTKDEHSNFFYPQLMNQGLNDFVSRNKDFSTLLPLACEAWKDCKSACFMQQTFSVSHSRKSNDESRVCYRLICKKTLKHLFIPDESLIKECSHIIHPLKYMQNDSSSICSKSTQGNKTIDSYNIKQ